MTVLSADLLDRIHSRAARYDRDNAFFAEDLDELKAAVYLKALVPTELGGLGLGLLQVAREQARLAAAAPATAGPTVIMSPLAIPVSAEAAGSSRGVIAERTAPTTVTATAFTVVTR